MMNSPAPFTVRQHEYLQRCMQSWFNVAEGGKRGGKNVLQTMAFCICLEEHGNKMHLVAGVSTATARLNILDCDGFGMLNYFSGRCRTGQYQNRDCLYVKTRTGEKVVLVSGGGKSGDEKLIKGNTYGMAYVTEANECHPDFLKEVFDRTMSSGNRKVFHDLNPKAEGHWYYEEILHDHEEKQKLNADYGYNYGHFTIADNMSVTDDMLKRILDTYNKNTVWYKRDIRGLRRQAEGLIYECFDPKRHVIPREMIPSGNEYYISVDYGTMNPFSAGLWKVVKGISYRVREYYHDGRKERRQLTDEEYYHMVEKLAGNLPIRFIIVDPSAASFIASIRKHNKYSVRKARNEVLDGIRFTSDCLTLGKVYFSGDCKDSIREFGLYSWDEKANEDKPIKENDHAMDDIRYFCMTVVRRLYYRGFNGGDNNA